MVVPLIVVWIEISSSRFPSGVLSVSGCCSSCCCCSEEFTAASSSVASSPVASFPVASFPVASSATGSVTTSAWLWLSVFCGSSANADVALLSTSTMQSMNAIKRFFVLLFMASSFYSSILTS